MVTPKKGNFEYSLFFSDWEKVLFDFYAINIVWDIKYIDVNILLYRWGMSDHVPEAGLIKNGSSWGRSL